jgi:Tol biopolymer transport system component
LRQLTTNSANDGFPHWSPDGSHILFTSDREGGYDLYVMRADGSNQTRVGQSPGSSFGGAWSPDGSRIAFLSTRDGTWEIYTMRADGTDPLRVTNSGSATVGSKLAWSPDGSRIAFHAYDLFQNSDIYVVDADGANQTRLTTDPATDRFVTWSPDGSHLAFTSNRTGDDEIYVMNVDGTGVKRLTASPGLDVLDSWRP